MPATGAHSKMADQAVMGAQWRGFMWHACICVAVPAIGGTSVPIKPRNAGDGRHGEHNNMGSVVY